MQIIKDLATNVQELKNPHLTVKTANSKKIKIKKYVNSTASLTDKVEKAALIY